MSKTWGYARCSTNEEKQDITRQINQLKDAGADEVIFEYEHGDAKVKKSLQLLLDSPQTTKDDIPAVFYKHYPAYVAKQMNVSELARVCGLSRPTVYKYLRLIS